MLYIENSNRKKIRKQKSQVSIMIFLLYLPVVILFKKKFGLQIIGILK